MTSHTHTFEALSALLREGRPVPWLQPRLLAAGTPRNGANFHPYGAVNTVHLWVAAAELEHPSGLWFTKRAIAAAGYTLREDAVATSLGRSELYNGCYVEGLAPQGRVGAEVSRRRLASVLAFPGIPVRRGDRPAHDASRHVLLAPRGVARRPTAASAPALLSAVAGYALQEGGFAVPEDAPWLAAELGGALLGAYLHARDGVATTAPEPTALLELLEKRPSALWAAARAAQGAVQLLLDLAHPALIDHVEDAVRGRRVELQDALLAPHEPVTALGSVLGVDVDDLVGEATTSMEEPTRLVLAPPPATVLRTFFTALADPGDSRAGVSVWLSGSSGTGRNQVVHALSGLLRHGGTDLRAAWLDAEDEPGSLLAVLERTWSSPHIDIVTCTLPGRFDVPHDRAIPTAALQAFHSSRGLSPVLWVARLEHRLKRAGTFDDFCVAFEALARRPWVADANLNPYPVLEHVVTALGGAVKGARRRVEWYRKTRATASWEALYDEVETTLYADRTDPDAPEPRVCFLVELGRAQQDRDPAGIGWLRRVLARLPTRLEELARPERRPFWFAMCAQSDLRSLARDVRWTPKERRKIKLHADLSKHPVTSAFQSQLLEKVPRNCGPVYKMYAPNRAELHKLATLEGWATPAPRARDEFLSCFPFLPPVLPVAQAVLDTLSADREADNRPLSGLVESAIRLRYYTPPDRFLPLDLLMDPVLRKLEREDERRAGPKPARVLVTEHASASHRPSFSHEDVLATLRLVSRIPGFPSTPRNLLPLMLVRLDRPREQLLAEVHQILEDLRVRRRVGTRDGTHYTWLRPL